jgi:hypothetical protein
MSKILKLPEPPMPKNKMSDPITDQEIAFARLVLSGTMTDRHAAETVGLNPDSAAYTKSKPHVRAYMHQHRAAVQQQMVQQEAEGLHRLNLDREKLLDRLWEIANLSPEMTRGSITGQVKALSMIIAMQNFIPNPRSLDRLAVSSEKKSPPAPTQPRIYAEACRAGQQPTTIDPRPSPAHDPTQSTFANRVVVTPSKAPVPYVPLFGSVPDLGVDFLVKNPFVYPAEPAIPKTTQKYQIL